MAQVRQRQANGEHGSSYRNGGSACSKHKPTHRNDKCEIQSVKELKLKNFFYELNDVMYDDVLNNMQNIMR